MRRSPVPVTFPIGKPVSERQQAQDRWMPKKYLRQKIMPTSPACYRKSSMKTLALRVFQIAAGLILLVGQAVAANLVTPELVLIYEPNADNLQDDGAHALESFAIELKAGNTQWISLEGFAGDGGSRELNLALAQRRVDDITRRLVLLGLPASRIHGISYGEEHMDDSTLPMRRVEVRVRRQQP